MLRMLLFLLLCVEFLAAKGSVIKLSEQERRWMEEHPVVRVGGESDWPPFDYVENGHYVGIAKDYLDLIAQKSGLKFEFITGYSWDKLIQMTKDKRIDLLPMVYISDERRKVFHFTKPYLNLRHYLYTLEDKNYNTLEDLFGKRVAVPKGFAQAEILRKTYPQINVYEAGNSLACIDAVMTKRADALIENTALISFYTKQERIEGIKAAFPTQLGVNRLYMATNSDQKILRDIVQKALDKISSHEKERIAQKWFATKQSSYEYLLYVLLVVMFILLAFMLVTYLMNQKIKKEVKKQTNLQKYLQNLTNNTFDAIATIDHNGNVLTWNKACEKIFGYTYEEIKGKNLHQIIIPSEMMEEHFKGFEGFQKSGSGPLIGKVLEVEGLNNRGEKVPLELTVNAISYENEWHALGIIRDLRDRKQLENRVLEAEKQKREIDSILNGSTTILILHDQQMMVRTNQAFFDFFDEYRSYEEFSAKHRCICEFFDATQEEGYITQAYIDGLYWVDYLSQNPKHNNKVAIQKQGKTFHFFIHVSSITLSERNFYLIELIDITFEKELELKLIEARDIAQKASQAKSIFLANMSHEIRTPLNGIIGLTNIVLRSDLNPQQANYLGKVKGSSEALLNIINDVLDYSKIEAGKLSLEKRAFDLNELLQSIKDLFGYQIEQKGLELMVDIDADIPNHLIGDKLRVIQVLNNLVGNALKFTSYGSIQIGVALLSKASDHLFLRFCVQDSGIGIDSQEQVKLFKSFSQVDSSDTKAYGGTGLGLVISKKIVELMGGSIVMHSQKGVGSQFCFTIPLEYSEAPQKDASSSKETKVTFSGDILLVEDDETNQLVAKEYLKFYGLDCSIVNNGQEAVDIVAQKHFDLIFMDLQMPVMDGFSATKVIRQMGIDTPIIALSAAVMKEDRELSKQAQMDGHIFKPIVAEQLEGILYRYLSYEKRDEHSKPIVEHKKISLHGIDFDSLMDGLEFESGTIESMLVRFAQIYRGFGDEMLQLEPASEAFSKAIHKLKGVSGNLKIIKVHQLTLAIERASIEEIEGLRQELIEELDHVIVSIEETIVQSPGNDEKTQNMQEVQASIAKFIANIDASNFITSGEFDTFLDDLGDSIDKRQEDALRESFLNYNYDGLKEILIEIGKEIADES